MRAKHWMPDRLIRSTATFGRKRHWTHATEPAVPPLTLGISNPETAEPLTGCRSPKHPTPGPGRWRTRCCPWTVAEGLRSGLASFVAGYGSWFQGQAAVAAELPEHLHPTADERLAHVAAEKEALRCFQFMNQVMRDHRKSLSEVQ
ncbi:Uncharacterised protein [Mycobacterium tuberculosis]|nr:Uncharacterised protein [Mycobacterium tuberculosis]CKQ79557.1 Uncharacterised protein [Mycobacterium tuberculosis]CKW33535.1 Uncharacterised protein [Mycobacterium tuberculosis]CKW86335.1 Uncharacterised protein [Mycobacterium tuberculosis]CKZ19922.1 Uncharacterised protein [Mycobacterium tuberculosis]